MEQPMHKAVTFCRCCSFWRISIFLIIDNSLLSAFCLSFTSKLAGKFWIIFEQVIRNNLDTGFDWDQFPDAFAPPLKGSLCRNPAHFSGNSREPFTVEKVQKLIPNSPKMLQKWAISSQNEPLCPRPLPNIMHSLRTAAYNFWTVDSQWAVLDSRL